ncbi:MAG: SDR family oxidoreductase [Maricaulaceae bacterium]
MGAATAIKFAPFKIRINTVCPGLIDTDMQRDIAQRVAGDQAATFVHPQIARIPMGRMSDPSEIANAIPRLASDEASYVTESNLEPLQFNQGREAALSLWSIAFSNRKTAYTFAENPLVPDGGLMA